MSKPREALFRLIIGLVVGSVGLTVIGSPKTEAAVTHEEVERAIREGVRFLLKEQKDNGSWKDFDASTKTGLTSLITLALLTAGEKPDSPAIRKAAAYLRGFSPEQLDSTYAIALQTMVFAAVDPKGDSVRIVANVDWLERARSPPAPLRRRAGRGRTVSAAGGGRRGTTRIPNTRCSACTRRRRSASRSSRRSGTSPERTGKAPRRATAVGATTSATR